MATRKLQVEIIGDASNFQRALRDASQSSSRLGSSLRSLGKVAAVGVGGAFAAMAVVVKKGFDEISDSQKVAAQTAAVLKSTGGIANVTAKHVDELAQSLSRMSGVDDELIGTGENLLLTFKNVRNEVGAGNKVFDRATQSAIDLSVAGFGSVESASKMLGKALNDPIKGMTALGRAGVTFSASQKDAIKALVETGDTLGAQRLILKEVESQVGGSAKAYGETLPGQLAKARNSFDEVSAQVAVKFLPALTKALDWVNQHWSEISAVFEAVAAVITTTVRSVATVVEWLVGQWNQHRDTIVAIWTGIQQTVQRFVSWFQMNVVPPIRAVIEVITALWERFGEDIKRIVGSALTVVAAIVKVTLGNLASVVNAALAILRGDWSEAWNEIKEIPGRTLSSALAVVRGLVGVFGTAARAIGAAVKDGIIAGLAGLAGIVTNALGGIRDSITSVAANAAGWAAQIGRNIVAGIVDGLAGLAQRVASEIIARVWDGIKSAWKFWSHSPQEVIGVALVDGIARGVAAQAKTGVLGQALNDAVKQAVGQTNGMEIAVTQARANLETAQATGDPAAIVAAQKSLDDALYKQKEQGLEQRALLERTKLEEQTAVQRLRFEDWVALRGAQQTQEVAIEGAGQRAILKKIESYNPFFRLRGQELGESLAIGLLDMRGKVEEAALELANAVAKALGVAYTYGKTAVGDTEAKKDQGIAALAAKGTGATPAFATLGAVTPTAAVPLSTGGTTIHVDLTVNGSVLTEQELTETVRRGLFDVARRNPGAIPGVAGR